jgi:two-component system sensor histidine kinase KdpD
MRPFMVPILSTDAPGKIAEVAARRAAEVFEAQAFVLRTSADGALRPTSASPADTPLDPKDLGVAQWAFDHGELAGLGTDTLPGSQSLCAPLRLGHSRLGVLALNPSDRSALRAEQRAFLDVFCRQVAVALERARLGEEARVAALRAKTEEMRSSLLSAVSHHLRTPLGSITGAATALRDESNLDAATCAELVESICDQAERLERLVANLLDMTRLESGALALKRDWVPLDEIVGSALTRLESRLGERDVSVDIPGKLPLLFVDPVLFEQIFVNLLENAEKYTPTGSPLDIRARRQEDDVVVEVLDRGPGLPAGTHEKVFEKFYRGTDTRASGAGLGLAICRGIAEAHGGSILAEDRQGGGAVFRVTVPTGGEPPPAAPSEGAPT